MEKFTNSAKSGSVFYKEKKKLFDVNNFVIERNGDIEIINESEDEDKKDTIVENGKYKESSNHYSKFSFDITNNEKSVKEKKKVIRPFCRRKTKTGTETAILAAPTPVAMVFPYI